MSVDLRSASRPHEGNTETHSTTVGGSKPLHRFIRFQPKIIGVVLLVLGSSIFILSIPMQQGTAVSYYGGYSYIYGKPTDGFWLGLIFITCGILYIITEYNPTKKMVSSAASRVDFCSPTDDWKAAAVFKVTISLALSVIGLLGVGYWCFISLLPKLVHSSYWFNHPGIDIMDDSSLYWDYQFQVMSFLLLAIFEFCSLACGVILIVMSSMAGAALRSTKSQAIVVMSSLPTE